MKYFLVKFDYEHYYQGYQWVRGATVLVEADSFGDACDKIRSMRYKYMSACNFTNETIY